MAHAHKGGISRSPGRRSAAPKQRYAPSGATIYTRPDENNHAVNPSERQFRGRKRRHGASLQRFPPWLAENATMGPLEMLRSRGKGPKRSGEAREAAEKPPTGPRMPCWTHATRPHGDVSCHPPSKTAQPPLPHKEKPAKRYEHLAGFGSPRLRTASSLPAIAWRRG